MPLRRANLCLALVILGMSLASLGFSGAPDVLRSRSFAPGLSWTAPQSIQADRLGNVYLLRGDTFEVFPIVKSCALASRRLQGPAIVDGEMASAAMAPDGSRWIVASANHVVSFHGGRTEVLPETGWFVSSVGYLGGDAVAGVLPMSVGGLQAAGRPVSPPLVLRNEGTGWRTYIGGRLPDRSRAHDSMDALFAEHTIRLAVDGSGRLWVSYPYLGRLVRYSPAGKPDLQVVLGSGMARYRVEKGLLAAFREKLHRQAYDTADAKVGVFSAKLGIRGMTSAPDGRFYLVLDRSLTGESELARLDPVRGVVESVRLPLAAGGELSMAGGRDGLYIAGAHGNEERWSVAWEVIEHADWRELANARVINP